MANRLDSLTHSGLRRPTQRERPNSRFNRRTPRRVRPRPENNRDASRYAYGRPDRTRKGFTRHDVTKNKFVWRPQTSHDPGSPGAAEQRGLRESDNAQLQD